MKALIKFSIAFILSTITLNVMSQKEMSPALSVDSLVIDIQSAFMNPVFDQSIFKEGIKTFKELVDINPDDKDWNYYLGMCYYKLDKFEEAEKYLEIASEDISYKIKILYLKEINDTRSVKL